MTFLNRHRSRIRPVGPFSPSSLFFGGIPGAWYDPTDLSTMFQDSAGTTPVTAVEQPVGLILDKSQGLALGAELVTSYYAGGAYGNWNTLTLSGTTLTSVGGTLNGYTARFNVTAGKTYRVQFPAVLVPSAGTWDIVVSWSANGTTYSGSVTGVSINTTSFVFVPPATAVSAEVTIRRTAASGVGATDTIGPFTGFSVRELAGNHASQSTAASRPTYRARYNQLLFSEQFNDPAWVRDAGGTGIAPVVTPNAGVAPDGTTTADRVQFDRGAGTPAFSRIRQPAAAVASTTCTWSVWMRTFSGGTQTIGLRLDATGISCTVTGTWQRFQVSAAATVPDCQILSWTSLGSDQTADLLIWGAQLLTAADVTATGNAYQRIAAATVYDTAPIFRPYLAFDGMDDSLATSAINFTATDKMSVFSGLSKLAEPAGAIQFELSADSFSNNGAFMALAPRLLNEKTYTVSLRGTIYVETTTPASYASPVTSVKSDLLDISGATKANIRINGASVVTNAANVGTGNFGNYPFFIGRRNNTSFPFNGRIYSLIVRGAASSTTEIIDAELWVNARTGGF